MFLRGEKRGDRLYQSATFNESLATPQMLDYQNLYEYKPPSRDRIPAYAALRIQFRDLDRLIDDQLPDGELKKQSRDRLYEAYLLADAALKNEVVSENNLFSD